MENIILIDTSYTLFYRFFATLRWLSLAHNDIYKEHINNINYNWVENIIFIEKYNKLYIESIIKLVGKKIFKNSYIIFCIDGRREQIWRTELDSNYKSERYDLNKKANLLSTFNYTYDKIIPDLIKLNSNMFKIKMKSLEADDIIAIICKNNIKKKIFILSADEDFKQLGRPDLYFINFKNKKPVNLSIEEAKYELHKKILLGDKSDCIKSIFPPRFSSIKKKKLLESIEEFNIFLKENKEIEKRYIENNKLINFDCIPEKYYKLINDKIIKFNIFI